MKYKYADSSDVEEWGTVLLLVPQKIGFGTFLNYKLSGEDEE